MKDLKKSDLVVGIGLGFAAGLIFVVAVALTVILLFPEFFDVWSRSAPSRMMQSTKQPIAN